MPDLTRDSILKMEAGSELNALVAEMMGWTPPTHEYLGTWANVCEYDDIKMGKTVGYRNNETNTTITTDEANTAWYWRAPDGLYHGSVSLYSTDIAAAWEVVEKAGRLDLVYQPKDDYWLCQFDYRECVAAPTAPLAICRAALLTTLESPARVDKATVRP